MPRFLLTIQFDGRCFFGWQRQVPGQPSVQSVVESAIGDLIGAPVVLHGAGRTDRGVHARAMSAHVDLDTRLRTEELRRAIDVRLPPTVALIAAKEVAPDFHARYHAVGKCYAYRVWNTRPRSPFYDGFTHHEARTLDDAAMRAAAAHLVGSHDFSAFATLLSEHPDRITSRPDPERPDKPEGNSRELFGLSLIRRGGMATFLAFGDGFLRGMVRCIVGTLLLAGLRKIGAEDVATILASRDRRMAGPNLPGKGLTLERVFYRRAELNDWLAVAAACEAGLSPRERVQAESGNLDNAPPELTL